MRIPRKWFALGIVLVKMLIHGYNFESLLTSPEDLANLMKHVNCRKQISLV